MEEMHSIGSFARLSGLTIHALRHYDEVGLLRPAEVDPVTAYRRYTRAQLPRARAIRRLRELDVPLDAIGRVLAGDPAPLARERELTLARLTRLQRRLYFLERLLDGTEDVMTEREPVRLDPDLERKLAARLFNRGWELMELESRTPEQDDELVHTAHASAYHWRNVGAPVNFARSEWQCSRVYAVLGRAEPALAHARRCLELCEQHGIGDFDLAYAYEALARAHALAGDADASAGARARAEQALEDVAEEDDRELLRQDLATLSAPSAPAPR